MMHLLTRFARPFHPHAQRQRLFGWMLLGFCSLNAHAAGVNVNQLVTDSAPSIVQVQGVEWVKVKIPEQYKDITDDPVYQSLSSIFLDHPNAGGQAAPVVKKRITGSGFIISSTGRIATNYQWVKGKHEIFVILPDKRQFKARVTRTEPKNDLAILQISANGLPAIGLARQVEEGEGVIAIGANKKGVSVGVIVSTPRANARHRSGERRHRQPRQQRRPFAQCVRPSIGHQLDANASTAGFIPSRLVGQTQFGWLRQSLRNHQFPIANRFFRTQSGSNAKRRIGIDQYGGRIGHAGA